MFPYCVSEEPPHFRNPDKPFIPPEIKSEKAYFLFNEILGKKKESLERHFEDISYDYNDGREALSISSQKGDFYFHMSRLAELGEFYSQLLVGGNDSFDEIVANVNKIIDVFKED